MSPPDSPSQAKSVSVNMLDNDLSRKSSLMIIPSQWNKSLLSDQTRLLFLSVCEPILSRHRTGELFPPLFVKKTKVASRQISEFELNV